MAAYRRAMAANTTKLERLTRKHRELSGLSEFYNCLYSDWDTFMAQFYDPDHQLLRLGTERFSGAGNADRWTQRNNRRMGRQQSVDTTGADSVVVRSKLTAAVSSEPSSVSGVEECVSAISSTEANIVTTRSQSEASESAPVHSEQTADAARVTEASAAEGVTMAVNRRSSSRLTKYAVPATDTQVSVDGDVKPVLDETVEQTFCCRRRKRAVAESGCMESVNGDIKPVAGLPATKRRNGSRHILQLSGNTGISSSATDDSKLRRRKHDVNMAVKPGGDVRVTRERSRPRKRDVSHIDDSNENEDVKAMDGRVEERRTRKTKQSILSADGKTTGAKNSIDGELTWTRFEEQDTKPDLSSLDVNVASVDTGDDVTTKKRKGRTRKFDINNEDKNMRLVIGTVERSRKCRKPKKSSLSAKNRVEVDKTISRARFEEQDVKPDLSSLDVYVASFDTGVKSDDDLIVKRRTRRTSSFDIISKDKNIKQVISTVERSRRCGKPKKSSLSANTGTKIRVEVDEEKSWAVFEQQDVKPDLSSLTVGKTGSRSERTWSRGAAVPAQADSQVSSTRCTRSTPFTHLSASQVKVGVES